MVSDKDLVQSIFAALINQQGQSAATIAGGELPRALRTGAEDGSALPISREIDEAISRLAFSLKAARPQTARNIGNEEWRLLVRDLIGPALASMKLSTPVDVAAAEILAALFVAIDDEMKALANQEYIFGTTLFSNGGIPSFNIGPVRIEHRDAWLTRKVEDGDVPEVIAERVRQVWSGGPKPAPLHEALSNHREQDIYNVIGPCPYVCSVSVNGFARKAGLQAAANAARLALTCIAMMWEPASRALDGFRLRYDGPLFLQYALRYRVGKISLAGSRLNGSPSGPQIDTADWATLFASFQTLVTATQDVLDYFLHPQSVSTRPVMLNTLLQSLLWFHEGCKEPDDLRAVVGFAASLDALGKGRKVGGILTMLEARLGLKRTDPIDGTAGGPTFKAVVQDIYEDGRSRAIHGTNNKMGHDWERTRALSETIARLALIACMDWSVVNPTSDDPDDLKTKS